MTDMTNSPVTTRRAVAEAEVTMAQETLSAIIDASIPKGDVLTIAELAGVMAGKRAAELIPLSHPVGLTQLVVNATPDRAASAVRIRAEAVALGAVGVEMEAMTAAAMAALTVYDMVREIEPGANVRSVRLVSNSDGMSDEWRRPVDREEEGRPPKGVRTAGRITPGPRGGAPFGPGSRKPNP
jgi:cyclic pyranopterin phosphate synthase